MTQHAPKMGTLLSTSVQCDDEFVYQSGRYPAWRKLSDLDHQGGHTSNSTTQTCACAPLTLMAFEVPPDTLEEVRRRVAKLDRPDVIQRYQDAYANGKRLVAAVMAAELVERGIPPCFWHTQLALDEATLEQRADLVLADLAWIRRWHPKHADAVRYRRGKAMLTGSEIVFRREAAFAFYEGKRAAWKIVGSMSMTERQQWEAAVLRSTPVRRQAEITNMISVRVRQALYDDLQTTRRTSAFTNADAESSLVRRHRLWHCARMVKDASPTEIAIRYEQMTGTSITRQVVAKQLEKIMIVLRAKGLD